MDDTHSAYSIHNFHIQISDLLKLDSLMILGLDSTGLDRKISFLHGSSSSTYYYLIYTIHKP